MTYRDYVKSGDFEGVGLPKSTCNLKDELVGMIRTIFGIGTIRQLVVSVLEVDVKFNLSCFWSCISTLPTQHTSLISLIYGYYIT